MSGEDALLSWITALRGFGKSAREDVAREAAPLVEAAVKTTAAAGTSPDGEAWHERKDGSRAMPDAASSVTATPHGQRIIIKTTRGYAINNNLKEGRRRRVLPEKGKALPRPIVDALEAGARKAFEKATRGQ